MLCKKIVRIILILIIFMFSLNMYSQDVCGTDEYNKPFRDANPEKYEQIERDIQNYLKGT